MTVLGKCGSGGGCGGPLDGVDALGVVGATARLTGKGDVEGAWGKGFSWKGALTGPRDSH